MTKHTPGPWRLGKGSCVVADHKISDRETGHLIAESIFKVEDAFLISAAPEMLEALKSVLDVNDEKCFYDHHGYCQTHNLQDKGECWHELATNAVKKATGQ